MTSEWDEFRTRLANTLRQVTDRVFLIVPSTENRNAYVQFTADLETLWAEAPGASFIVGDESVLAGAGWTAPTPGQPNWTSSLPFPALTSEYDELAVRCVAALRDAYGVPGPHVLVYQAWREKQYTPEPSRWRRQYDPELDAGESPLALPALGLPEHE